MNNTTPNEPLRSGRWFGHLSRVPAKGHCDFCGPRTGTRPTVRVRIDLGCCDLCADCRAGLLMPVRAEMPLPNAQAEPRGENT